jgi:hypothetical protein
MGRDDESEAALLRKKASASIELIDKSEAALLSKKSSGGITSWES